MKLLLKILSYLALAGIIVPPFLYLSDSVGKALMSTFMIVSSILWFCTVPFWMGKNKENA